MSSQVTDTVVALLMKHWKNLLLAIFVLGAAAGLGVTSIQKYKPEWLKPKVYDYIDPGVRYLYDETNDLCFVLYKKQLTPLPCAGKMKEKAKRFNPKDKK